MVLGGLRKQHKLYNILLCLFYVVLNMKNMKTPVRVTGKVVIVVRDAKTKKVLRKIEKKNVITNAGLGIIASRVANPWTAHYWCLALGVGTGTPDPSDTDLFAEVAETRKTGEISLPASNQVQYFVRYLPEEANGYTFTECGIFENTNPDLTGGTLFNHLLISPAIEKTEDKLVDFYITITFS